MLHWLSSAVSMGLVEPVTPEEHDRLRRQTLSAVQTTLASHAAAATIVSRLKKAGVDDVRVLKGCATGILDYSPVGYRYSTDVDVLVRASDYDAVFSIFPAEVLPASRSDRWKRHTAQERTACDANGIEIDVHMALTQGYFGLVVPPADLMRHADRFEIGGTEMLALDGPGRLIHAAVHTAQSEYVGLHSARDVLQLALVSEVDWREAVERVTRWRIDGLFALGVVDAWSRFAVAGHPLLEWAQKLRPDARQRLALRIVGNHPRRHVLTAPLGIPLHRWPGFFVPLVWPSREFLAERGSTRIGHLRAMVHDVAQTRSN